MYCIDTSSLISAWRFDYPPDIFRSLWTQLDELIKQNRIFSSLEVLLELKQGGDAIYEWANARNHIFLEADDKIQTAVSSIMDKYPSFIPEFSAHGIWADPYIIAMAHIKSLTVVTGEKANGPGAKKPKIPNICQNLGIECIDFLSLIRQEGWMF